MRTEERRLQDAVRELRDTAASSRHLQERQAAGYGELRGDQRAVFSELRGERTAVRDIQSALDTIGSELQEIRQQLRLTATTIDQIGPMIPNMLRTQRLARLVFGPPFWFARYLYRRARRRPASRGASEVI
jgi:chromosome segregation ATPase